MTNEEINRDHLKRAYRAARAGELNECIAQLEMALYGSGQNRAGSLDHEPKEWPGAELSGDEAALEAAERREAMRVGALDAWHAAIQKSPIVASAILEGALWPEGIPPHEQIIEWFKYLPHSQPIPEGWADTGSLANTHHGEHARLIRKIDVAS